MNHAVTDLQSVHIGCGAVPRSTMRCYASILRHFAAKTKQHAAPCRGAVPYVAAWHRMRCERSFTVTFLVSRRSRSCGKTVEDWTKIDSDYVS